METVNLVSMLLLLLLLCLLRVSAERVGVVAALIFTSPP